MSTEGVETPNGDTAEFDLDYTGEATEGQNLEPTAAGSQEEVSPLAQAPQDAAGSAGAEGTASPAPEEVDDLESLRQQLADANMRLLQFEQSSKAPTEVQPPQVGSIPPEAFPQAPGSVSSLDFLGGEDHVSLLEDRDKFNALLNKVATVAYNAAVTASQERILRQIPGVVETAANQQFQIKGIVERFYTAHSDLEPYKPAVSMAAMKLHNENPAMPLEEILNKAAEETRRVLRIRPNPSTRPRVPAQPVGSGRVGGDRTAHPSGLTEQEQQILELLS